MAYIYRLEQLDQPFKGKVNAGPWWGKIELADWAVAKDFYEIYRDESHDNFKTPNDYGVHLNSGDVCGVRSYQELNEWFPNRYKRREAFRVVKYHAPDDVLIDLPNQVVVNASHLKQVAVLEMFG